MYEDTEFAIEKLSACIYSALRWQNSDPNVSAAWSENQSIVNAVIRRAFANFEKAIVKRTLRLRPEQLAHLKRMLDPPPARNL